MANIVPDRLLGGIGLGDLFGLGRGGSGTGRAGLHLHVLALIALEGGLVLGAEADLDLSLQGEDLGDHAGTVGGIHKGSLGGCLLDLLGVGIVLVAQATHETAAAARDLGGVQGQILLLGHLHGHLTEIRQEGGAAQGIPFLYISYIVSTALVNCIFEPYIRSK